jgi:hypothetical protein
VKNRFIFLTVLALSVLLAACGPSAPQVDSAVPTRTPRPTFTPTPVAAAPEPVVLATDTPAPQSQAAPAEQPAAPAQPTPTLEPQGARVVVTSPMVNVRSGPGTQYDVVGQVDRGEEFQITGKNPAGDWWQICCVSDRRGWIAGFLVDTSGPVEGVAVAAEIPAAPQPPTPAPAPVVQQPAQQPAQPQPAAPTPTPVPAEPTPTPAPAFALNKGSFVEPRSNSNQVVSFFGVICKQVCPGGGAAGGYRFVVEGPHGRSEATFGEAMLHGDPGLASEFIYNVKLEIPGGPPGSYRAYVVDSGGNQVSEAWEYTAQGDVRTFLPRWVLP